MFDLVNWWPNFIFSTCPNFEFSTYQLIRIHKANIRAISKFTKKSRNTVYTSKHKSYWRNMMKKNWENKAPNNISLGNRIHLTFPIPHLWEARNGIRNDPVAAEALGILDSDCWWIWRVVFSSSRSHQWRNIGAVVHVVVLWRVEIVLEKMAQARCQWAASNHIFS